MTLLTAKEAGERLGLSSDTIRKYCWKGTLKGEKKGRDWFISEEEINRYKAERNLVGRPRKETVMERIVLKQFGPVTRFDAAHIIDDSGRIGAYIAEPEARNGEGGMQAKSWDEEAFRAAVEAEVASWEARNTGDTLWIQYDPGRDNATEVKVELKG